MKPIKLVACLILLFIAASQVLDAVEIAPEGTMARKAQRGFLNVALSPMEISHEIVVAHREADFSLQPDWLVGVPKGIFSMLGRASIGIYELLTAPLAVPAGRKPIVTPEFAWQLLPAESETPKSK